MQNKTKTISVLCLWAMLLLYGGCSKDEAEPYPKNREDVGTETSAYAGNPDIFMAGQSNANPRLAQHIETATGMSIHQISHPNQPIENWFEEPYNWIEMDLTFLGDRSFTYLVWFHGESNLKRFDDYEEHLNSIVTALSPERAQVVIIVGVWTDKKDASAFRGYQLAMCDRNVNYYFIDSIDCPRHDGIHLNAQGRQMLAGKISELISVLEAASPTTE